MRVPPHVYIKGPVIGQLELILGKEFMNIIICSYVGIPLPVSQFLFSLLGMIVKVFLASVARNVFLLVSAAFP